MHHSEQPYTLHISHRDRRWHRIIQLEDGKKAYVSSLYFSLSSYCQFGFLVPYLKVPKREIFDHSDFHDFYAIKSLTVSGFGVKIKICLKNI